MLVLAAFGLAAGSHFNLLPAETVFELMFEATAGLLALRYGTGSKQLLITGICYVGLKFLVMRSVSPAALSDFVQAYKAYIYLIPLSFFVGAGCFKPKRLARLVEVLSLLFFLKYSYSRLLHLSDRPGIYLENNYELVMLVGLYYLAHPHLRRRNVSFGLIAATVILSGSRSGAICLGILYLAIYVDFRRKTFVFNVLGAGLLALAVERLFLERLQGQGLQHVDRYNFLQVWLAEIHSWPWWKLGTGSAPLTPLSPSSCGHLIYYKTLFSHAHPGVCYSVILHAFFLRAIFDQGIVGLILLYVVIWRAMTRANTSLRDRMVLMAFFSASATSVSAFNNVFVAIVIAVALGLEHTSPPTVTGSAGDVVANVPAPGNARLRSRPRPTRRVKEPIARVGFIRGRPKLAGRQA